MRRLTVLLALAFSIALPVHAADKFIGLKMELNNPKNKPAKVTAPDHPVREGKFAYQFALKDGSCRGNKYYNDCKGDRERSEYTEKKRTQAKPNQETWYAFSMFVPKSTRSVDPSLTNVFQFQDTSGSGEITLGMFFEKNGAFLFQSDPNNPQVDDMNPPKPLREIRVMSLNSLRGRWHDFVVQAVWSPNSNGLINVWLNGKKIYSHKGKNLVRNVGPTFKFGIYRGSVSKARARLGTLPTQIIYFDAIAKGKTKAAVAFQE